MTSIANIYALVVIQLFQRYNRIIELITFAEGRKNGTNRRICIANE